MGKKPNAANITHALAQLGGGAKKDGGDGMMKGLENVFKTGIEFGAQIALSGNLQGAKDIGVSSVLSLGDKISE
jgi:glycerate kinase